jgi:predicted glycogen debranching enzyme
VTDLQLTGWRRGDPQEWLAWREWLATNALGGYAAGTIAGVCTRRYHGILVAALPQPLGRYVVLNHLEETVELNGSTLRLSGDEASQRELQLPEHGLLEEFRLELGLPVWIFANDGFRLEKRLVMPHLQNTTIIEYRLVEATAPVTLTLRPSVHFRPHEADVSEPLADHYELEEGDRRVEIRTGTLPPLRLMVNHAAARFQRDERTSPELLYRIERSRGYRHEGLLWSPGRFTAVLSSGDCVAVVASTEQWAAAETLGCSEAFALENQRRSQLLDMAGVKRERDPLLAQLVLAADQFIVEPHTRTADTARRHAAGDEPRTVIAGYHWFTDWGRDTMISLEGLTLATGRLREAGSILRTFADHIRDGLIPNMFPEGENDGLYHTADATMWFFHAVARYVAATGDRATLRQILPSLHRIIDHHLRGTRFGIGVDPADGLLRQGAEGYQLTWMDAKVDGWVVTPRRGKAVEINALFYNALRQMETWSGEEDDDARAATLGRLADRVYESFNRLFWYEAGGYLYDVVDGEDGRDDPALRPNQVFSISLDHPVLQRSRWERVVNVVRSELLTPVGLRSLARNHLDYKPAYDGDLRARDAAYHQGTVWGWLIGPFCDAWAKVHPHDREVIRRALSGFEEHLADACAGSISEVFDAEAPYTPRGCVAQAWSVAEVFRCLRRYGG